MNLHDQSVEYPAWQPQLLDALSALDPENLRVRVAVAELALFWRGLDSNVCEDEREAMRSAARQLRTLHYPPAEVEQELDAAE